MTHISRFSQALPQDEAASANSGDLRIRRTRKLIQQAFVELTVEQGFAAITVQEIADRAMINRSTFYRHYLDKYDLLEKYMDEVYAKSIEAEFVAKKLANRPEDVATGLLSLLKQIEQDADFFRVMLGPKGDVSLFERMRQNTVRRFQTILTSEPPSRNVTGEGAASKPPGLPLDLRINYISYAGMGAIKWWLDHLHECSAEQLARWLSQLSSASAGLMVDEYLRRANSTPPSP